jgi:hypothetical protein
VNGNSDRTFAWQPTAGEWNFLSVSYSVPDNVIKLSLNGVFKESIPNAAVPISFDNPRIGGWLAGSSQARSLEGSIASFRVWSVATDGSDACTGVGLVAAYELDSSPAENNQAADSGPDALHGEWSGTTKDDGDVCAADGTCETTCAAGSSATSGVRVPGEVPVQGVKGCTDRAACNFDGAASVDDESCVRAETGFDCAGDELVLLDGATYLIPSERPLQLAQGGVHAVVDMPIDYEVAFTIVPGPETRDGWASIVHLTATGGNCCDYGDRIPAVWFHPGTRRLHVRDGHGSDGNAGCDPEEELSEGASVPVRIVLRPNQMQVLFGDAVVCEAVRADRTAFEDVSVYAADPWHPSADATIERFYLKALEPVSGCTDRAACNFDGSASVDDESCVRAETGFDCAGDELVPFNNVALEGMATQSSQGWAGAPSRAIDGNTATQWAEASCTHTQNGDDEWWQLDLGGSYSISNINIYHRSDCCQDRLLGAKIMISDTTDFTSGVECNASIQGGSVAQPEAVSCHDTTGRYLTVAHSNDYITICEFEANGRSEDQLAIGRPFTAGRRHVSAALVEGFSDWCF